MSGTTSKITVTLKIEYDLNNMGLEDFASELQEVIEKAREYGFPFEATIESDAAVSAELDV